MERRMAWVMILIGALSMVTIRNAASLARIERERLAATLECRKAERDVLDGQKTLAQAMVGDVVAWRELTAKVEALEAWKARHSEACVELARCPVTDAVRTKCPGCAMVWMYDHAEWRHDSTPKKAEAPTPAPEHCPTWQQGMSVTIGGGITTTLTDNRPILTVDSSNLTPVYQDLSGFLDHARVITCEARGTLSAPAVTVSSGVVTIDVRPVEYLPPGAEIQPAPRTADPSVADPDPVECAR